MTALLNIYQDVFSPHKYSSLNVNFDFSSGTKEECMKVTDTVQEDVCEEEEDRCNGKRKRDKKRDKNYVSCE